MFVGDTWKNHSVESNRAVNDGHSKWQRSRHGLTLDSNEMVLPSYTTTAEYNTSTTICKRLRVDMRWCVQKSTKKYAQEFWQYSRTCWNEYFCSDFCMLFKSKSSMHECLNNNNNNCNLFSKGQECNIIITSIVWTDDHKLSQESNLTLCRQPSKAQITPYVKFKNATA